MSLIKRNNLFEDFVNDFFGYKPMRVPSLYNRESDLGAVNVKENDKSYSMDVFVPGFQKQDINIEVEKDIIKISANIEEKNEDYNRKEFSRKSFMRSFTIPEDADMENVSADLKDGILNIIINKKSEQDIKTLKKIDIK